MNRITRNLLLLILIGLGMASCSFGPPPGISVVRPFKAGQYLGTWYEIARLDHRFERGLTDIRAIYRQQKDGSLEVINRGFDREAGAWHEAVGRAKWVGASDEGALKVSFFGPFYGAYNVVALDQDHYRWSLVMGPDPSYFWILAREKRLDPALKKELIRKASGFGIATDQLIWTPQDRKDD